MLSGVMLVNSQDMGKERFEEITGTKVAEQYKIIPKEIGQQVVAKKATTSCRKKATPTKKKTTKKKVVKKTSQKKKKVKSAKKKVSKKKAIKKTKYNYRYNVGEIQSYAHNLVRQYDWSEEDYQALVLLVNRESSWNPYSVNKKSKACGLFQAYPCSKMAKYGKDYRTNYKVQMKFGFEYIKARYGNPQSAWAFWQKNHWY